MEGREAARDVAWLYVAGPIVGLAALYLTARLGVPQILRLAAAFRGIREHDRDAAGDVSPGIAVALSTVGAYGAAGAVGAATAISIGGAGAIAWIWLGGIL